MQETWVRSLGWGDPPEEGMVTHSNILGEGTSNPLQYSCLENPMDCIVHWVAKSWTQLSDFHFHSLAKASVKLTLPIVGKNKLH